MPRCADEIILSIRERVANGERVAHVARDLGMGAPRVWRIARGEVHAEVGGPISPRAIRRIGERRHCLRCRHHFDEQEFAYLRDAKSGVCKACERPDDDFPKRTDRSARLRELRAQARARLLPEVERLRTEPWMGEPLPAEERARIRFEVTRRLWV